MVMKPMQPTSPSSSSQHVSTADIIAVAVMMVGTFTAILNQTLMVSALPTFIVTFHVTSNTAQWLSTGFMLVNGIMIPVTAYLIQRFTTRSLFLYAIAMFLFGTIICAAAPGFTVLLLGRVVQATGAGILMPLLQTVLFVVFPPNRRGMAMGIFGMVIGFAPALGPTISGLIIDHLPWRYLFVLLLVIQLAVLIAAIPTVRNVTKQTNPRLDVLSVVLSTLGFGGLLYGFSIAGQEGWSSPHTMVALVVGVVCLFAFVYRQLHLNEPMLNFRVFALPMFTLPMVIVVLLFVTFISTMNILPMFLQDSLGYSALTSGLLLMGGGVAEGVFNPISGHMFDKTGAKRMTPPALLLVMLTTFGLIWVNVHTPAWYVAALFTLMMTGVAFSLMPLTTTALNELSPVLIAHGTAMNNTVRQTMAAIGTGIYFTIMTSSTQPASVAGSVQAGLAHGVSMVFIVSSCVAALAFVLSLFVPDAHQRDL